MSEKNSQPVRGTHDLLGDEYRKHQWIQDVSYAVAQKYGYEPIATPIFEYTSVFKRTIGETSDIVGKEMYTFDDRGGDSITLRPEGTAGVVRAVISNSLTQSMPLKLIYDGPMMRYERPQKGRTRQFHQVGVECIGIADPLVDVETIALGAEILEKLEVLHRSVLEINTLGDIPSRTSYRQALVDYFTPHHSRLSADSQVRLTKNPLRILDSKDPQDREFIKDAPAFDAYLNDLSKDAFKKVCEGLENLGIPYKRNPHLVRGLDYYCHTAFEFVTTDLGSQGALLAGGRYDGLVAQLGGPETPGVGWAMGIDRIALMLEKAPSQPRPIAVIAVGDDVMAQSFQLAMNLRKDGIIVEFAYSGNVGKRLKRADKVNACAAILIGTDEIASSQATVRNLDTGEQNLVAFSALKDYLMSTFKQR
ncbi:MAG: histidine--tRNA ligase [Alphaproteobacteria bacterium]|jgi:histidyl-tRNA synthetase|nr:histidine--tRNA ligase [Alphaproteobacteria bacterium]